MRLKYKLPDDPAKRIAIWTDQLNELAGELSKIRVSKMQIAQNMLILRAREAAGQEVGSEISACRRQELHTRMGELAAMRQKEKLENAITDSLNGGSPLQ